MKKIFVYLILGIFLISFASASLFQSNKVFNHHTFSLKERHFIANHIKHINRIRNYGSYDIHENKWLGLLRGQTTQTYTLLDSGNSIINAWAYLSVTNYRTSKLLSKMSFTGGTPRDLNIYYFVNESYQKEIPIYKKVCNFEQSNKTNSTFNLNRFKYNNRNKLQKVCKQIKIRTKKETKYKTYWKKYNNQIMPIGNYKIKITAKLPKVNKKIDWILNTGYGNYKLDNWLWWNSNWLYKKQISFTANVGQFSYLETIPYSANMNADFSDLRFVDTATETTELNYTIESYTASTSAIVRIFSQGANNVMMYYGNPTATTTSSASNTYFNPISYYYLDEQDTTGTGTIIDAMNVNNGTNVGATNSSGKIGTSYNFQGNEFTLPIQLINNAYYIPNLNSNITITAWFNNSFVDNADGRADSIYKMENPSTLSILDIFVYGAKINFRLRDDVGADIIAPTSVTTLNNNTWYFMSITYDTSTKNMSIFINGNYENGAIYAGGTTTFTDGSIGGDGATNHGLFHGKIDEVGIWNKVLTSTQISELYNSTAPSFTIGTEQAQMPLSVTLNSPINNSKEENTPITFDWTSTPNSVNLINTTLIIWNSNNTVTYNKTIALSGSSQITSTDAVNLTDGYYSWGVETCSDNLTIGCVTSENRSFELDTTPFIEFLTPLTTINNSKLNQDYIPIQVNISTLYFKNITYFLENINGTILTQEYSNETLSINFSNISDGYYNYNVTICTTTNQCNITETRSTELDKNPPIINFSSYPNGTYDYLNNNSILSFNFSATDQDLDSCWYQYPTKQTCYQESTNIPNQQGTDGNCGLKYTGNYDFSANYHSVQWINENNVVDGDYSTYGHMDISTPYGYVLGTYVINYTKPSSSLVNGAIWNIKLLNEDSNMTKNYDINKCFNSYNNKIILKAVGEQLGTPIAIPYGVFYCYNSTDWIELGKTYGTYGIFDDSIKWYNQINHSIPCINETYINQSFYYKPDANNLTVFVNDTFGHVSQETKSWDYNLLQNNISYNTNVVSGELRTFKINVTYPNTYDAISMLLNYNGTNYTMQGSSTSNTIEFSTSIIIPSVFIDTNQTFYYIATLSNTNETKVIQTDSYNQSVGIFGVDNCSTYNDTLLNFKLYDQDSLQELNGTIKFSIYTYADDTGSIVNTFNDSYNYIAGQPSRVCIKGISGEYRLAYKIKYQINDSYFDQYKNIQKLTITNESLNQTVDLYDLKKSRGYAFDIIVVGNLLSSNGNSNLLVDAQRQYISKSNFLSIESSITDATGNAVAHLVQSSEIYNFIISQDGKVIGIFNNYKVKCSNPSLDQCAITLNLASAVTKDVDIKNYGGISQTFLLDNTTNILYDTFNSLSGASVSIRDLILKNDGYVNTTICDNTISGTSGTITCSIPIAYQNESIVAQTFVNGKYIGTHAFSQGITPDWQGVDIIIIMLMFSSLVLLMIAHPITMTIGAILGLVMPVLLISSLGATFSSIIGAVLFYIAGGVLVIMIISRRKN